MDTFSNGTESRRSLYFYLAVFWSLLDQSVNPFLIPFPYSLSCLSAVDGRHATGKLDRTWPPPNPKSARENPGQTQVQLYFPRSILPVTGTQHVIHSQALIAIILYVSLCWQCNSRGSV